jgi:predicted Rossmann fold nucleotide-binding protein DprA/Smf involved in DNA uptake
MMDITRLNDGDPAYPTVLRSYLGEDAPSSVAILGNLKILSHHKLGLFCSVECPGKLSLETCDFVQHLQGAGITVISGFHSPMERACLRILLRGTQPLILCPARSLTKMRIHAELKKPLETGRLLFLSAFAHHRHRSDIPMALNRNRFVAALADRIFVPDAAPGSKTEEFCKEMIALGKSPYTMSSEANKNLSALGASPVTADQVFRF